MKYSLAILVAMVLACAPKPKPAPAAEDKVNGQEVIQADGGRAAVPDEPILIDADLGDEVPVLLEFERHHMNRRGSAISEEVP